MEKSCNNCPFGKSLGSKIMKKSLCKERMNKIKSQLKQGLHFMCHKTTRETGNGSNKICAGSIEWQKKRGIESNYLRICRRLKAIHDNTK